MVKIEFEIEGRRYEAVSPPSDACDWKGKYFGSMQAIERTEGESGGAIGEEDARFLRARLDQLPASLRDHRLLTKSFHPKSRDGHVLIFYWADMWYESYHPYGWGDMGKLRDDWLVLRRVGS